MDNVSRPLIALLLGTVAFFALWLVALKPSSSGGGGATGTSQGLGAYQSAIGKAHQAVATENASGVAHGATTEMPPARAAAHPASTAPRSASAATGAAAVSSATGHGKVNAVVSGAGGANRRLDTVTRALEAGRVVALLFFNPAATDDQAVRGELASVPTHGRKVVKLAVPLSELTQYSVVTSQVIVNQSPTLVLIDGRRQAAKIVGFADRFEIEQRVADALAAG